MVDSTALKAQPFIVAFGSAIVKQDFVIPRSQDYRRLSVYLKTMSKNQIVMSWFYRYATRQDSTALKGSRSDWSSVECFVSLDVGPEPMVEPVSPFGHCSTKFPRVKHSNFEDSGFGSWC